MQIIGGGGMMQFSGTNTYSGNTNIFSGGTLQISSPSNIGTNAVAFASGASLGTLELLSGFAGLTLPNAIQVAAAGLATIKSDVAAGQTVFLSGNISGPSGSTFEANPVNGSIVRLSGNNTFGGFVIQTVATGTLQIDSNGGLQGQSVTTVGSLVFNQPGTLSFTGTIAGPGSMSVVGAGNVVMTGTNTYFGTTTVNAGTLTVNAPGSITPSVMTVNAGGTLAGNGTVFDVTLNGTVAPGSSIGTLNVGNFTFNPGSTYNLEISDTTSDLIASTGTVTINGGSLSILPLGFTTPNVSSYTVITALTTVTTNTPFTLINPLTRYRFGVLYNATSVVLEFLGVTPFADIVTKGKAGKVAKCFDTLVPLDLPDLAEIIHILDLETPAQMAHSFNQMHPANLNNVAFAEENVAERIRQIYTDHFFEQRVIGCPETEAWRLWVAPFVERARQHGEGNLPGYLEQFAGFSAALDYHWQKHWMITGGFSYASTEMNVPKGRTKANFKTYAGTLGTAWSDARWFADAQIAYLFSQIDEKRKMHFAISHYALNDVVNRTASHDDDSNQVLAHIGGGYDWKMKATSSSTYNIYPFANLDYIYIPQDGYSEHGAGSLDLKVNSKAYDLLRPEGGIGLGYYGCFKRIEVLFDMSVSYIHEFRFLGEKTTSHFKPSSCKFTVTGLKPENNLVSPQARLRLTAPNSGFSLTLGYHGEYGEHFIMNAGEAELRKAF